MSLTISARSVIENYYALVDSDKLSDAIALMDDNVKLTFANAEPVFGRAAAEASVQAVLDHCDKILHTIVTCFEQPGKDGNTDVLCEIRVKYNLKNGNYADLPACVFATIDGNGVFTEQRLYADLAPVLAE